MTIRGGRPRAALIALGGESRLSGGARTGPPPVHGGERLVLDPRRLEAAHLDQNRRKYEITTQVSLAPTIRTASWSSRART